MTDKVTLFLIIPISIITLFTICVLFYDLGVRNTQKEAFEMGLMTKEITKDDTVIYKWIQTHQIGYE